MIDNDFKRSDAQKSVSIRNIFARMLLRGFLKILVI